MIFLARLNFGPAFTVEAKEAGRLVYREGNREYVFPIYEEGGCIVLVGVPSELRVRLLFDWHSQPAEFCAATSHRIIPRISAHLENRGERVRVFDRSESCFSFHSELLEARANAVDLLSGTGLDAFADFDSVDLLHEEYGLEVAGIRDRGAAERTAQLLQYTFPQWHYVEVSHDDADDLAEALWRVAVHMFPAEQRENNGWFDSAKG